MKEKILAKISIEMPDNFWEEISDKVVEIAEKNGWVNPIRCGDCKYCYVPDGHSAQTPACKAFYPHRHVAEDDFCSYAERREECEK